MILYSSVSNTLNLISVQVNNSHSAQCATAQIEAEYSTLEIGDFVEIQLGYSTNHMRVFTGYVKNIEVKEPARTYSITCSDVLIRAMDFFIASSDPNNPFKRRGIKAETLVQEVLALSGLTNYTGDNTLFTFGINNDVEVNLTSSYDYSRFIADILAYNLYADLNGLVHFTRRLPYVVPGDVSIGTITEDFSTTMSISKTDKDLRNRVVVYGNNSVYAEAVGYSPYLPDGFYKTVVVAAPTVFDNTAMAQQSADYNLELLNRLTESVSVVIVGDPSIQPRVVMEVINPSLSISGLWYVYAVSHTLNSSGYTTNLELRR